MQPTKKLDFDLIFVKRYFRSVLADQSNFLFSFSSFSKGLSFFVIFYHCFCYHCKMVLLFSFPRETKYKSCVSCTFFGMGVTGHHCYISGILLYIYPKNLQELKNICTNVNDPKGWGPTLPIVKKMQHHEKKWCILEGKKQFRMKYEDHSFGWKLFV